MTDDQNTYRTPTALRTALEERLRRQAHDTGVSLDRLRKEVAHQRLLARLVSAAPTGSWALKGGQALLARLDAGARATRDTDATWRHSLTSFTSVLEQAADTDLQDGFDFEVAASRPLTTETEEGGLRYPVLALLDGREFERLQLDVNILPGDDRPIEQLRLRDLLGFAGIQAPTVPAIPVDQHLAEKLHAYCRDYGSGHNTRPRDLYDMLIIASSLPVPRSRLLHTTCHNTFLLRRTDWPPALPVPPGNWTDAWNTFVHDYGAPWTDLYTAGRALAGFWEHLLTSDPPADTAWDAARWRWTSTQDDTPDVEDSIAAGYDCLTDSPS